MLSPSSEDYLESIFLLDQKKKVVRVKDISTALGVSMPSVHQALRLLKGKKLVKHERYGYVEITQKGKDMGKKIYRRYGILFKFFTDILGVPQRVAREEICRIEHYISERTQDKIANFIKTVESCPHSDLWHSKHIV